MGVIATTIKRCTYRFLNDKTIVYYPTRYCKLRQKSFANNEYYTEPFIGTQAGNAQNALIAYVDLNQCTSKATILGDDTDIESHKIEINQVQLKQFKHLAYYFNMPALVVINNYCDVTDRTEYFDAHYVSRWNK